MQLFDIEPIERKKYVILSASRMTDMPKFYPKDIILEVNKRIEKGLNIHTLVLWTKHPRSLLKEPLKSFLIELKKKGVQLSIQLTITGMGQKIIGKQKNGKNLIFEPNVPEYRDAIKTLPEIIELIEKPDRIRLRIDPIIRIRDYYNQIYSNLKYFPEIIERVKKYKIKNISFSFLEDNAHQKVNRRLDFLGCKIIAPNETEREKTKKWIKKIEKLNNITISACCVPGFEISKCIDGELLSKLHDKQLPADLKQPKKRKLCGCTSSIDIGGWPPKKCYSGCEYCYANSVYNE